ncbi:MAG: hypothetical protein Q8J76_14520 [Desulfobulbaceae bacterium]|nr:hypothetical protein [Desulfobulbaceae bacterium]
MKANMMSDFGFDLFHRVMNSSVLLPGEMKKGKNRPREIVFLDNTLFSDACLPQTGKSIGLQIV